MNLARKKLLIVGDSAFAEIACRYFERENTENDRECKTETMSNHQCIYSKRSGRSIFSIVSILY